MCIIIYCYTCGITYYKMNKPPVPIRPTKNDMVVDEIQLPELSSKSLSIPRPRSMNFSVFIENKSFNTPLLTESKLGTTPPDNDIVMTNLNKIYPKEASKWASALNCQNCNAKFVTFLNGMHHCRACGGAFCGKCASKYIYIPVKYIQKPKEDSSWFQTIKNGARRLTIGEQDLVCDECYIKIKNLNRITTILSICDFLDLEGLYNTLLVSKDYYNATIHQLSKFRAIQYASPTNLYKTWELNILLNTRTYLSGHDNWLMALVKGTLQKYYENIAKIKNMQKNERTSEDLSDLSYSKLLKKQKDEFLEKIASDEKIIKMNNLERPEQKKFYDNVLEINKCKIEDFEKYGANMKKNKDNILSLQKDNIMLISNLKKNMKNLYKIKSCWNLMCSRKCNINSDMLDFIDILKCLVMLENENKIFWKNNELKDIIKFLFKKLYSDVGMTNIMVKCIIPMIYNVFSELMNCEYESIDFDFLEKIFDDLTHGSDCVVYFINEIDYLDSIDDRLCFKGKINFSRFIKKYVKKTIDSKLLEKDIIEQINIMRESLIDIINEKKTINEINLPILYPLDYNYKIVKIEKYHKYKSSSAPVLLNIVICPIGMSTYKSAKIIIKKEKNLRKEMIISNLMILLQHKLFQQAEKHRIEPFELVPTYQIVMITNDIAAIEFVENSATLQQITNMGKTLQNYISENNPTESNETTKKRFSKSLAISSCLSYMLGLYDRHTDNIMINTKGQIFHIDPAYIMSVPTTHILNAPNIKMTSDMIDVLGDQEGPYYKLFEDYLIHVYDILRLYKNIIINYYELLGNEKLLNWDDVKDKLDGRFLEGLKKKDVKIMLIHEIKTSISYSSMMADIFHNVGQKITGIIS